jgi:hypothetical protein
LEGYFYPHGIVLVVTTSYRSILKPQEAVEKAFEVRRTGKFKVAWEGQEISESLSLDELASLVLTNLHSVAFGSGVAPEERSVTPFTVFTVIRGKGVDPSVSPLEGGQVHRMLEAVTTWRPTWQYDALPDLSEASLRTRAAPPSHVLYGRKRGRAVWFPALFIQEPGEIHSLSCYHRNLVLVSLQVESLSGLISATAKQIGEGIALSACHRECARRAAGILGRLYGGVATYKSWSPRVHIEQNDLVKPLNDVRDYFNMSALS